MDLCGPIRVASINGKRYILVIIDDFSLYTWIFFLHTKDEAPDVIINFITQIQWSLQAQVLKIWLDNGTEFKNEKLRMFYAKLRITHNTSTNRSLVYTRYNKTTYEMIQGRKSNVQYFHMFESLCYPTNDHDDPGKMKPKADIGIFIGYSESSRGFRPSFNCLNFQDSLEDSQSISSREDLENLFDLLYEEYYAMSTLEVSNASTANTVPNKDTPSSSSIVVEENEAPQIITSSKEPIANENANEPVQENVAAFDENVFYNPFYTPVLEEVELSSTFQDPLNMHEFYQKHHSTNLWTKNHKIKQVIGDPSKHVMTRCRLYTDAEMCMYA
ncbi:retrovirus-related pol polyprotein from transposon TNT 1-94, partial [Tanacetum coccineum]